MCDKMHILSRVSREERQRQSNYLPCHLSLTNLYIVTHISVLNQNIVLIFWFEIGLPLFRSQDVLHLPNHAIQRPSKLKYQVAVLKLAF